MAQRSKAGHTRKSHKSRKTELLAPVNPETVAAPDSGTSSTALATTTEPSAPPNPLADVLAGGDKKSAPTADTGIIAEDPKKQWWQREPTSSTRKVAEKIFIMRAAGRVDKDIAKRLKTTEATVRQAVYIARKNGWTQPNEEGVEEIADLEEELALTIDRKIVRNIGASLDGQMTNWQTHEMTLAAAKGRGVFKGEAARSDGAAVSMPIVAIQVIMPAIGAGDQLPNIKDDQMGGTPAYTSDDVVEGEVHEENSAAVSAPGDTGIQLR